jgi:hypothetical protein
MFTASEIDTAPECMCGDLPAEDRDECPVHGTYAQAKQARRIVSVGRTQSLYDASSCLSALAKIEDIVNGAMTDGDFNSDQIGIMRWALRKCHAISDVSDPIGDEL